MNISLESSADIFLMANPNVLIPFDCHVARVASTLSLDGPPSMTSEVSSRSSGAPFTKRYSLPETGSSASVLILFLSVENASWLRIL